MIDPIQDEYKHLMRSLADAIDGLLNEPREERKTGFALLMFPFGDHQGRMNYISNADREHMLIALKEFIAHAEGRVIRSDAEH